MSAEQYRPIEYESLIGKPAVEVVRAIFRENKDVIRMGSLVRYSYSPGKPAEWDPHIDFFPQEAHLLDKRIENNLEPDFEIAISSRVVLFEGIGHLPMIDFELEANPANLTKIQKRLPLLFPFEKLTWVVLDSGLGLQAYCVDGFIPVSFKKEIIEADKRPILTRLSTHTPLFGKYSFHMRSPESSDFRAILNFGEKCHSVLDYDSEGNRDEIVHSWFFTHCALRGEMCLRLTRNRPDKRKIPEVVAIVKSD